MRIDLAVFANQRFNFQHIFMQSLPATCTCIQMITLSKIFTQIYGLNSWSSFYIPKATSPLGIKPSTSLLGDLDIKNCQPHCITSGHDHQFQSLPSPRHIPADVLIPSIISTTSKCFDEATNYRRNIESNIYGLSLSYLYTISAYFFALPAHTHNIIGSFNITWHLPHLECCILISLFTSSFLTVLKNFVT